MQAPIQMPAIPTTRMTSMTTHCQWLEILHENTTKSVPKQWSKRSCLGGLGMAYQSPLWPGSVRWGADEPPVVEVVDVDVVGAAPFWTLQTLWYQFVMEAKPLGSPVQALSQTPAVVVEKGARRGSKQKHEV